jgi:hypothetical protein
LVGCDNETGGVLGFFFHDVAEGDHLRVGGEQIAEKGSAASAEPDHGDAGVALLEGNIHHAAAAWGSMLRMG